MGADDTGLYGSHCKVNSDCHLGFICLYNKCSCPNSYIYDNNKQACRKLCRGSSEKLVRHGSFQHQYNLYKQRYTNCTYVDENLEITNLEGNYDLSFLKDIEEVMGYVLIVNVFSNYLNLTNLQIIRGETLYDNYSLYVALNHNPYNDSQGLLELQFSSLSEIVQGQVFFKNNNLLCYTDTIKWEDINPSSIPPVKTVFNSPNYKRQCVGACHSNCYNPLTGHHHCWGSGPDMCQKLNYVKQVCHETCDGRCFGNQQNECCHPECAAGCTGPRKTQCYACRHFYNEGQCDTFCPQMMLYDKKDMEWVPNPVGRYSFGALCVKDCPNYMLKNLGACVIACPPGTRPNIHNNECEPEESACDGPCPRNCNGISSEERFLHSGNIQRFENCTIVEGNLKILKVTFKGDNHTGTEGVRVEDLKLLSSIKEITGFLNIQEAPEEVKNLSFLSNLEIIRGRDLSDGSSLALVKLGIRYLGLTSLTKINNGDVLILMNPYLCYLNELNLTRLFGHKNQQKKDLINMSPDKCAEKGGVCDSECTSDGCWGPGPKMCLECRNVRSERDNKCLGSCTDSPFLYATEDRTCKPCDELCADGCDGPGPEHCTKCKKVEFRGDNNKTVCMEECPVLLKPPFLYPDDDRICQYCDPTCAEGCTGPSNAVKVGGCNTCELAINITLNGTVHCLPLDQDWCPDGFYSQQYRGDTNHPLIKKQVCQPCHHLCLKCSSVGTTNCEECRYYRHYTARPYSNCVEKCPSYTYPSEKECKPCDSQCLMGCTGPNNTHCKECQNFKIILSEENKTFACVKDCPDHLPELVIDTWKETKTMTVCANDEHPDVVASRKKNKAEETKRILTIAIPTVGGVILLGVLLTLIAYYIQRRAKAKENTAKLTARMTGNLDDEPMTPTNIMPDLSKLRLIKESEMRRGGIIGSGAFGTVYKGLWIPEGENVKIPVAIKVLQEGTSANQNQELLEEARVMASVEHPCCIRILAVCMASQMMLVTQLMPLGCLLDYIKKHKDNAGSKALLNWCTQIAKGMAYLEERGIVHRDLAARNVLVQSANQVKITDFGLAKLLDYNEDEYHAAGGKMPIKWLALECIQLRVFTHKSDVWSYGVTVWELFTYGSRPYEHVRARDVPDLLEKGERLPQPAICTIDVYMIMIKCWMLDANSRPSFKELSEEFAKMARDPGRYLVIAGDTLMRLPSYSYDKDDLARHLSVAQEGPEEVVEADEYLQPQPTTPQSADSSAKVPLLSPGASNKEQPRLIRDKRYNHLESAAARQHNDLMPKNRYRGDSINGRYSSDPVKYIKEKPGLVDEVDSGISLRVSPPRTSPRQEPVIQLPLDEDDYLQPKSSNPKAYLELENNKDYYPNEHQLPPAPPTPLEQYNDIGFIPSVFENPEYFEGDIDKKTLENNMINKKMKPKIAPKPRKLSDYYNEPDKLERERRPLLVSDPNTSNCSNSETTI